MRDVGIISNDRDTKILYVEINEKQQTVHIDEQLALFWAEQAKHLDWHTPWQKVVDCSSEPVPRWFSGGRINTCFNALDRHVDAGRGDQDALIFDSAMTGHTKRFTYQELRDQTAVFAGAMVDSGITKGDRVLIYMPMIPEAVIAMLACARIGAIHSVVFGGFAAAELATRINDAQPKMIISASCGLEPGRIIEYKPLLDSAIDIATHKPKHCVIFERPESKPKLEVGRDQSWNEFIATAKPHPCVPVEATDPLYILYTSGTTGQPKGIVRDNGGHAVAMHWSMDYIYDVAIGDVFWAASDIGWVVGHSYIVYGPLLKGATTLLYEGKPVGTPDASAFWRVAAEHKVSCMFTAPTAIRAIKRDDPNAELLKQYDLSKLKALFLAGERCDPNTLKWSEETLKLPVIDHWWQTETGWSIAANPLGKGLFEVKPGSAGKAMPGWQVEVLDSDGKPVPTGTSGEIACKLPLPPGSLVTLWHAEDRFKQVYLNDFRGYYKTGDAGYIDEEGYIYVMTRTDDIINVAGHRLSTGAIEEVLASHPDIAECAVTGINDNLKGQVPLGFLCLKSNVERDPTIIVAECISLVRKTIGAVVAFKRALVVQQLPKTRSGKVLRGTLKDIANGNAYKIPATIDDPTILTEIQKQLATKEV